MRTEEDLLAMAKSFVAAWNARDLDAIIAFVADDTILRVGPPPALPGSVMAVGKQQIRSHVRPQLPGFYSETWDYKVSGDRVSWRFKYSMDYFRDKGIDSLEGTLEVVFKGDKISESTVTFSPQTMQRLAAI